MKPGASSPEELETLFEDAFVLRDRDGLCALFVDDGVLAASSGEEARGSEAIGYAASDMWVRGRAYVGGPQRVVQAGRTALVVTRAGTHVVRRVGDGTWRLSVSLLGQTTQAQQEGT